MFSSLSTLLAGYYLSIHVLEFTLHSCVYNACSYSQEMKAYQLMLTILKDKVIDQGSANHGP